MSEVGGGGGGGGSVFMKFIIYYIWHNKVFYILHLTC